MEDYLISFIVPVYNAVDYVTDCLDSILRQTVSEFEVLIIDDGSFDGSGSICDEFAERDERVKVIHTENHGVSHARNTAIRLAKGKYLAFVDADDLVSDRLVENIKVELEKDDEVEMICWSFFNFIKPEDFICQTTKSDFSKEIYRTQDIWEHVVLDNQIGGYVWNKIFLVDIIRKHCICFRENIAVMEDLLFVCEYLEKCSSERKIVFLNNKLYGYRQRDMSVSHIDFSEKKLTALLARDFILEILKKVKFSDYLINQYRNQLLQALCVMNKKLLCYRGENRSFWLHTIDELWSKHKKVCRYDETWQFKVKVYRLILQVASVIRKRGKKK